MVARPKKPVLKTACLRPEALANAGPAREWCQLCGLFGGGAKTPFMASTTPEGWESGEQILVVGEAPSREEDEAGTQFVGKSGQILRKELSRLGLKKQDVSYTNAVRCRPPGNATPAMTQVRCCRPFLLDEITRLAPERVIGVGTTALRALTNDGGATLTKYRGRLLSVPREEAP